MKIVDIIDELKEALDATDAVQLDIVGWEGPEQADSVTITDMGTEEDSIVCAATCWDDGANLQEATDTFLEFLKSQKGLVTSVTKENDTVKMVIKKGTCSRE